MCTLIDNGMPVVVMRASDFGKTGHESPEELEADAALKARVETVRLAAGRLMNLGDVTKKTVPKMCLVARAGARRRGVDAQLHPAQGAQGDRRVRRGQRRDCRARIRDRRSRGRRLRARSSASGAWRSSTPPDSSPSR